ncbi:type II toxin-antitoxin system VapC family toxin [Gloeobacter kilaueensis]|uniref:type II toxin-antitoxin system VapC family toxin n=1 Tax=Gloeobacter kilaueensis TaxID=1416614 RepID=UPI001FE0D6B5|nr:type II toxin-antitoxin system VapC family toxin [Gloeobacter kilaueensis]
MVDASVAAGWFFPEVYSESARQLLNEPYRLIAPDLFLHELGNIAWKKVRHREMASTQAVQLMRDLRDLSMLQIRAATSVAVAEQALEISMRYDRSFYDSLYLALALEEQLPLITADRKLYNALQGTDLSFTILWVERV